jgi:superfamily II DNA or RNA helicase
MDDIDLTVHITATPTMSKVDAESAWALDLLEEYLTFDDAANQFVMIRGQVRRRTDSPKLRLLNLIDRTFPTGLLPMVCKHLKTLDIPYKVTEDFDTFPISDHDLAWLREEQKEAVQRALQRKRGILHLPTGAGKTEIAIGLALKVEAKWLFIVHKKDLLHQTAERYERRTGLKAGKIGDGKFEVEDFTVATYQTLSKGLKTRDKRVTEFLDSIGALAFDECHTAPANSAMQILMGCNATYRYGLSGTPLDREDNRSIFAIGAIGPVIFRIHPSTLIEAGLLAKPYIYMPLMHQESDKKTWQGVYGECIVRSTKRNNKLVSFSVLAEKPALLFVKEIKHGHILEKKIRKAGVSCEFIWGNKDTAKRDAAVRRLVNGDIDVLIVSVIFQEGTDIPSVRSVIIASSGKSVIAAIQRVGRGMRLSDGKKEFYVYDVFDTGHRTLAKWAKKRKAAYLAQEYEIIEGVFE